MFSVPKLQKRKKMQKWEKRSEENSDRRGFQVTPRLNRVQLLLNGGHRALLIVDPSSDRVVSSHPILQRHILHALTSDYNALNRISRPVTCVPSEHSLSSEGGSIPHAGNVNNQLSAAWAGDRSSLILYTQDQQNHKECKPHCSFLAARLSDGVNGVHTPAGIMIVPHQPVKDVTTSHSIQLLPSITELQTVPESTALPRSSPPQDICSLPPPSENGIVSEELVRHDASGDSTTTTAIEQSDKSGLVPAGFSLTQTLLPLCEGREKLLAESDEEIDMSATDDTISTSNSPHLRKSPISVVVDSNLHTLSPPPSHAISHIVHHAVSIEPEPRETPPQKRARLCSDASQKCVELNSNVGDTEDDGLLSTEAADDGSATEDQTVPRECAREHGLVPSPAPCNQHWPQGGGGEGGAGGEAAELRNEGYWGDGDEESLWLHPVRSGEISYQQIEQQVVPDEPEATKHTVSSLYDQQDDGSRHSPQISYLDRQYQRRVFSPHTSTAHTCCSCNTRVSEFPSTVPLNLSRPRLRLGLSKCQSLQSLHSRYSTISSREE